MGIRVLKPGMLTTVQDLGRWGYQTEGVPVSGPMDARSHRLANRLVGNPPEAATLEVTLMGPQLLFEENAVIAIAGATFEVSLNGEEIPMNVAERVPAGSRLRFGSRVAGARSYIGVWGGIDVPAMLGSRATHLPSRMGGLQGRALMTNDLLPIGSHQAPARAITTGDIPPLPNGGARLRVLPGPQADRFTHRAFETLQAARYLITPQSDRMGYRLQGPPLQHTGGADLISDVTPAGALQVPGSGQPIVLMADRQTSGGYPMIATIITADLPIAGQLAPGDWIEFSICSRAEALGALQRLGWR